jgi:hypothetical protein
MKLARSAWLTSSSWCNGSIKPTRNEASTDPQKPAFQHQKLLDSGPLMENRRFAIVLGAIALSLISCGFVSGLLAPATATPAPTATSLPTSTLEPTPTLIFIDLTPDLATITPTVDPNSPEYWACLIRSQVPKDGARFSPKERFDVAWQVENHGYGTWDNDSLRVTYFSGTRMQVNDSVQLKENVLSDHWTQFVVPMVAPRDSGKYTTVWALWHGDNDFCHMKLSIVVK